MFLRPHSRIKDGKRHSYWSLVETVRTPDGPRQRTLCYLGELNDSAQVRWLKTIEVFNQQGESRQLKLFPSEVQPPANDPDVAQVLLSKVRLERTRQLGPCYLRPLRSVTLLCSSLVRSRAHYIWRTTDSVPPPEGPASCRRALLGRDVMTLSPQAGSTR